MILQLQSQTGGSFNSSLSLDTSALAFGSGLSADFNETNGILSIISLPEPSRALLLVFGLAGALLRRRRTSNEG